MNPPIPPLEPPTNPPENEPETPSTPPSPATPDTPEAAPPPAGKTVLEGTKTERELALERTVKDKDRRLAELEDENRTLKTPPPKPRAAPQKESWLSGTTFFD